MEHSGLPATRVMNKAFQEKGRDDVVKIDAIEVSDGAILKLTFEGGSSRWRQGVWLKTDAGLTVNNEDCVSVRLWRDTAPKEVLIRCRSNDGRLYVYNIWDKGRGLESQALTSGMLVENLSSGRRYRCNDIGFDTNFDKLVFSLAIVDESWKV